MLLKSVCLKTCAALTTLVLLAGCETVAPRETLLNFNASYYGGDYPAAAQAALQEAGGLDSAGGPELLWSLQAGSALTASGQFILSNQVFDNAEQLAKVEDTENLGSKGVEKLTATLVNNNINNYSPTVYDGVMINTYKALNNIFLDDPQNARIEFNRAADRQRRAEEHFRKKIDAERNKQEQADSNSEDAQITVNREGAIESVYEAYPELNHWKVYPDYVNPYTDYLHGLHFMLASADRDDYGKARDSLRRVAGMMPENSAVQTDLMVVENLITGKWRKKNLNAAVWVVFENGLGPEIEEVVIPIPLFLVSDKVEYSQIALPKLRERSAAYAHLELSGQGKSLGRTELVASMDRVVQTEFKKEFPLKVTEAVISTLTKGLVQHQAGEHFGPAGSLLAGIYQVATTRADTRIWTALPKDVQIARVRPPKDRRLMISAPGMLTPLQIELPDRQFSVVYIKASAAGATPVYQVAGYGS